MACEPRLIVMVLAVLGACGAPEEFSSKAHGIVELETALPCGECRYSVASASLAHPATIARPRSEQKWRDTHQRINADVMQKPDAQLVFVGDSITSNWMDAGKSVWQRYYAGRRPLNLGIFGDLTQQVLWRLRNGNLDGLAPETVVLLIGVNNALDHTHQPHHIVAGVAAILDELRQRLPHAKILLLAILPAAPFPCWLRDKLAATNAQLAELARPGVRFLDIGEQFLDGNGFLSPSIAYDFLHLTERGYRIWARSIELTLREMLFERAPIRSVRLPR